MGAFTSNRYSSSGSANLTQLRIQKELQDIQQNPPINWKLIRQRNDLWDIWITTDIDSPFHSIPFKVTVSFPPNYPEEAPKVKVQAFNNFFHPNVSPKDGGVCERTVKAVDNRVTIRERIDAFVNLLANPNPYSPLNGEASAMYKKDYHQYYKYALYKFRGLS